MLRRRRGMKSFDSSFKIKNFAQTKAYRHGQQETETIPWPPIADESKRWRATRPWMSLAERVADVSPEEKVKQAAGI